MKIEKFFRTTFVAFLLTFIVGCAVNPVTQKKEFVLMSEEQELAIGKSMDPKVIAEFGLYNDPKLQEYVNSVGQRMPSISHRPELIYRFKVLDSTTINAMALPGGYIYVTRGLLAHLNSEAELATVLGHEIGHVTARHAVQQITKAQGYQILSGVVSIIRPELRDFQQISDILFYGILQGYGRKAELQSDQLGMEYAYKTGYDPLAAPAFLKTLRLIELEEGEKGYHGFFASHPETEDRIKEANGKAGQLLSYRHNELKQGREEFLSNIEGLLYGENPEDGITIKNVFKHPVLRFEMVFPEGWKIENTKEAVVVRKNPDREEQLPFIQLGTEDLSKRISVVDYAEQFRKKAGFKIKSGGATYINGLRAYVGTAEARKLELGKIRIRFGLIFHEDKAYHIIGAAKPEEYEAVEDKFDSTILSFKALSRTEAAQIRPTTISIYTVKEEDTLESIFRKERVVAKDPKEIARFNGLDPSAPLKVGEKLKLITTEKLELKLEHIPED